MARGSITLAGVSSADDGRVGVAGQRGAVSAMQVDVLVAVDVVHLGAGAVAEPDWLWLGDLPVGCYPAGEHAAGMGGHLGGLGLAPREDGLLFCGESFDDGGLAVGLGAHRALLSLIEHSV